MKCWLREARTPLNECKETQNLKLMRLQVPRYQIMMMKLKRCRGVELKMTGNRSAKKVAILKTLTRSELRFRLNCLLKRRSKNIVALISRTDAGANFA